MQIKIKKGDVVKAVLGAIGVAGILAVGIVAPNVFAALPNPYQKKFSKKAVDQSVDRLRKRGLIKFVQGRYGWRLALTDKGLEEFSKYEMREKLIKRPRKWDGRWHLLVFDIDEKRKLIREKVRRTLIAFGFYRLQDSVWVFPYECEDILELLRTKYGVRYDALYICAQKIAKDQHLRKYFNLIG
ncbi:CRISPR-associated endonuclease Cas2 [Candidatus Uhrbacteria bacterium]|nr:CRISPR-associated endonuclease Cas2 [Candidatus Uhrbacteria bacterium]